MLDITGLTVGYRESVVLTDVHLHIEPGRVVCLMGRNGVGKTTLLKSVMGLLKPRAGHILFDGRDITASPSHKRAKAGIGYVPQGRGMFPYLTVRENLLMGLEAAQDKHESQVERMYDLFPVLKTMAARPAGILSGGQQQQLAIARALIAQPRLLLLDEPTEGIQPSIIDEIEALIQSLRERRSVSILLVEQFLEFALNVADDYYILEKGAVVAEGSVDQLEETAVMEYLAV